MMIRLPLAALLAACTFASVAHAQVLAGPAVEAALKGKTFNTEDFGGTGTIAWAADGKISVNVRRPDGTTVADTGTYRFDGKGYCSTWTTLRTTEKCFTLRQTSATTWDILNPDGSLDSKLTAR
jgi:hypothetical protein